MRPSSLHVGGVLYWSIRLFDPADGVTPIDADSTPTVSVRKNGAAVGDSVTVSKRAATTGIYDCSYNPAGEVEGDKFSLEESATIAAVNYSQSFAVNVFALEAAGGSGGTTAAEVVAAMDADSTQLAAIRAALRNNPPAYPRRVGRTITWHKGEQHVYELETFGDYSSADVYLVLETRDGAADVAVIPNASFVAKSSGSVQFTIPTVATESKRNLKWAIRHTDTHECEGSDFGVVAVLDTALAD